jgi:hypothetical protein
MKPALTLLATIIGAAVLAHSPQTPTSKPAADKQAEGRSTKRLFIGEYTIGGVLGSATTTGSTTSGTAQIVGRNIT